MLNIVCPSCNNCLGEYQLDFETKKDNICNNPKFTKKQQEEEISKLLNSYNFRRYCCKMRLMTSIDWNKVIQNYK
jgi:DNA-directed RNA polymerase subunit N (RpoN/RPB10)